MQPRPFIVGFVLAAFFSPLFAQPAPSREVVTIEKVTVQGTRFQPHSIQILTGLARGVKVDEVGVRKAISRMMDSGLIKNVNYNYESLGNSNKVALELTIIDETPLLPATIEIPGIDAEDVWNYLDSVDPLFTRELPRTQKALNFYIHAITDFLRTNKRKDAIVAIITGDAEGNATGIVFQPATPPPPSSSN